MKYGDHIKVYCGGFWHHGIYVGRDRVIHYTNPEGKGSLSSDKEIIETSLATFAGWGSVTVTVVDHNEVNCCKATTTVKRAIRKLGSREYDLMTNNCEHFANWCKKGKKESGQTDLLVSGYDKVKSGKVDEAMFDYIEYGFVSAEPILRIPVDTAEYIYTKSKDFLTSCIFEPLFG